MAASQQKDRCAECGEPLERVPSGEERPPCPECGSTDRRMNEGLVDGPSASDDVGYVHEGKRRDWGWTSVSAGAALGGVISGVALGGVPSIVGGAVLGAVSFAAGEKAVKHFRHTG